MRPTSTSTATAVGAYRASASGEHFGVIEPRLFTPPLADLDDPANTYGYELIEFADSIGEPFDPWQRWLSIHVGELLPDGTPRFRTALVLVSRQSGKTRWAKVWGLWCLFSDMVEQYDEVATLLTISSKVEYAKEVWLAGLATARACPMTAVEIAPKGVREANGQECVSTVHNTRWKIAASNEDAGRSLTVHRLMVDELRRQKDFTAWAAAEPTTTAVADAQIVTLSNQGDDTAVVLDSLRIPALEFIESGEGDPRLGLFEWSAPDGSDPTNVPAILQANPNVGYRFPLDNVLGRARRAKSAGGEELAKFKTEQLCMRVHQLDPAIDPDGWEGCFCEGTMDGLRDRVALCLDVSLDLRHAILVAGAVMPDDRVRVESVKAWSGLGCTREIRRDLPAILSQWRVKPRVIGYFPGGPAASVQADLADPGKQARRRVAWPPPGVQVREITADTPGVCMSLAETVLDRGVAHSRDPLIDAHVEAAQRLWSGDRWRFCRKGATPVNGAYAVAGAVHLAKTLPPPVGKPRLVLASGDTP